MTSFDLCCPARRGVVGGPCTTSQTASSLRPPQWPFDWKSSGGCTAMTLACRYRAARWQPARDRCSQRAARDSSGAEEQITERTLDVAIASLVPGCGYKSSPSHNSSIDRRTVAAMILSAPVDSKGASRTGSLGSLFWGSERPASGQIYRSPRRRDDMGLCRRPEVMAPTRFGTVRHRVGRSALRLSMPGTFAITAVAGWWPAWRLRLSSPDATPNPD